VVTAGVLGIGIGIYSSRTEAPLIDLILTFMGYFAGGLLGLFLLGMLTKRANGHGAFTGAVVGHAGGADGDRERPAPAPAYEWFSFEPIPFIWSTAVGLVVTLVVGTWSRSSPAPPPPRTWSGPRCAGRGCEHANSIASSEPPACRRPGRDRRAPGRLRASGDLAFGSAAGRPRRPAAGAPARGAAADRGGVPRRGRRADRGGQQLHLRQRGDGRGVAHHRRRAGGGGPQRRLPRLPPRARRRGVPAARLRRRGDGGGDPAGAGAGGVRRRRPPVRSWTPGRSLRAAR
jgi:hypothetical protein